MRKLDGSHQAKLPEQSKRLCARPISRVNQSCRSGRVRWGASRLPRTCVPANLPSHRRGLCSQASDRLGLPEAGSDAPLVEIALSAGFSEQSHFSRTFKRLTGLTPSEYRSSL